MIKWLAHHMGVFVTNKARVDQAVRDMRAIFSPLVNDVQDKIESHECWHINHRQRLDDLYHENERLRRRIEDLEFKLACLPEPTTTQQEMIDDGLDREEHEYDGRQGFWVPGPGNEAVWRPAGPDERRFWPISLPVRPRNS
jgi:hypothetical protein